MTLWVRIADDLTGSTKKRNYNWAVFTADTPGAHDGLAQGVVKGHQLAKGWKKLLKKVTNAAMKVPERESEQPDLPFTPEHDT